VTRTLAEFALLAALLVAAWLIAVGGGRLAPSRPGPPPSRGVGREEPVGAGLPERAEALRTYLASPPPRPPVRRNPFGFGQASPAAAGSAAADAGAALSASRPEMALAGIAEDTGNGHPVRTAVISTPGELVFAREGDRVLSRFLVLRIAADAVQLKDDKGGEVFVLALK